MARRSTSARRHSSATGSTAWNGRVGTTTTSYCRPTAPSDGLAARVRHPASGRVLEIRTAQPCVQLYSGNLMRTTVGKLGVHYGRRSALCLEPAGYPDAVHQPAFESVILEPGVTYRQTTSYRLL